MPRRTILLLLISAGAAQLGHAEGLREAWDAALSSNHILRATMHKSEAAELQWKSAKGARLPSVTVEAGYMALNEAPGLVIGLPSVPVPIPLSTGQKDFLAYGALVSQPLWTAGRISHGISAAKALSGAAQQDELLATMDLKLEVARAYITVLRAERMLEVTDAFVESLDAHETDVRNLYEQGVVARSDLLASQVALADAHQKAIQAANALDLARSAYNRLLGRELDNAVELEELGTLHDAGDLEELTRQAWSRRAEVAGLELRESALLHRSRMLKGESLPQVALFGGYSFLDNSLLEEDGFWSAGIGFKWDLFDGNRKRNESRAARSDAAAVAELRNDVESQIALQVRKAWLDIQETRQRISVAVEAVAQAEESQTVAVDRYANGLGTNTEVLDTQTALARSRSNHHNALYDAELAWLEMQHAVGEI